MALQCGIVGLPNVGKSTLFNALTQAGALAANYPFATKDPNVGVVTVPDYRLDKLEEIVQPQKTVPTTVEIVDIAGLIRGASKGEGLGNQFLANIREVNAIMHVVRCFDDGNVTHVDGGVDPVRDKETIDLELIFKDMETLEKRKQRLQKLAKALDRTVLRQLKIVEELIAHLEQEQPARSFDELDSEDDEKFFKELQLLTAKPIIYICNVDEASVLTGNEHTEKFKAAVAKENAEVILVSAAIEADIAELEEEEERKEFLADMGLEEPGVNRVIRACYNLLELITYFTAGEKEVRAWTIRRGTKAPQAAGVIHSDIERGFIKARTVAYEKFVELGGWKGAQEVGAMRQEGKEYLVQDGDLLEFMHNT
ncbi:redox-regulated ATPase YchF [Saprospira grandis]|uniref:Ribosome-binding ATPase YchF n=1 Tax=Saprospira grandis (strain Lewin) TaxID=984262 RepID=H6LAU8_SAPGL|nr:redox-regulated ATPase YchF [Saprospira grandis]AFC25691.1 GTP-binding protein YchF [Saprospira grandis str. Lewin]WBM73681.1 redox-regulated ATPase YchF [Saprospira grandis]